MKYKLQIFDEKKLLHETTFETDDIRGFEKALNFSSWPKSLMVNLTDMVESDQQKLDNLMYLIRGVAPAPQQDSIMQTMKQVAELSRKMGYENAKRGQ